ncbi:DUF4215 domain-containing protein [Nannocystis sp. SCPEA4]|uniref:DUF4215 domain-containing protein n=1 Tax=Nannocystis sp. SCPEA4 TaxID=2996787 RepID=UPI0022713BDD|nr:DUF4215 domain-containing protein [Nannocystis sp. SCPEA4]MCY1056499.1 DUF4215 domain-containing protein [Nannocystis sp. SCPEA4]
MRLSPRALTSAASLLLVACSEAPATSSDTASSLDTTGTTGSTSIPTSTSTSTSGDDSPTSSTTSIPTTGDTTMTEGVCGDGIVDAGEQCDAGPDNGPGSPCNSQCRLSACGDGELGPGEECDDGGDNGDNASCTADCTNNICGDGKVGPGEGCDDGNDVDDDECTAACAVPTCGDRIVDATEECDDGNDDDTDACTGTCTSAVCSDGFLQPDVGEQCDDGPDNADDAACTTECKQAACGDGHVWISGGGTEECDDGPENGPGKLCNSQCLVNVCGDGDPNPDEQCDDGNVLSGDGCSATCGLETCGNSIVDPGEQCDDGQDGDNADDCTDACKLPACGDGIVQPGEACDLGGLNSDAGACTLACKDATCGDGLVHDPIEQCDDGPSNGPGQSCKANCTDNYCGDGDKGPGEACDDGNGNNNDSCTNACKAPTCGDGAVQAGEECDLGAGNDNTGECTHVCKLPVCGDGFVQPGSGETCDDGNTVDRDACPSNCDEDAVSRVLEIGVGEHHFCARLTGGRVKCWGYNHYGVCGREVSSGIDGDQPGEMGDALPYTELGVGVEALALAVGRDHNCAIVTGGHVKCWGWNGWGQLGLGDNEHRGDDENEMGDFLPYVNLGTNQTAVAITVGNEHTCALLDGGKVKCWGAGDSLGHGQLLEIGELPGQMGDNLPFVDLGTNRQAVAIDAGGDHTCALLDDNTLKCWGGYDDGALGLEDTASRGSNPGEMGDNLPAVKLGLGKIPVAVSTGENHTCALLNGGLVKCWGAGMHGALGYEDEMGRGVTANSMGDFLPVVKLGQGNFAQRVTTGEHRTCVLLTDHRVKCWGNWYNGFTGTDVGDGPDEMGDELPVVDLGAGQVATTVVANHYRTCVLLQGDRLKCWGNSWMYGLGYGDTMDRGDTDESMGDNLPFIEL